MNPTRRPLRAILAGALALGTLFSTTMSAPASHLIFLGTYTKHDSKGIYTVTLDAATGVLSAPALVAETPDPAWIALNPRKNYLYAIHPSVAQAVGYRVEVTNGAATLTPVATNVTPQSAAAFATTANPPSHLAVDATGQVLLGAHYREGYVESMAIRPDGLIGPAKKIPHTGKSVDPKRQGEPHAHSVTVSPDNRHVIVCDLGLDKIFSYALDPATATLTPAAAPFVATTPGSGPRHFKFGADGRFAYAITEMGGTIEAFSYTAATGALTPLQVISSLPGDFNGLKWGAEVRVHPSGKFLYASNRTHDSLAVFSIDAQTGRLTLAEIVPSGGKTPRNFNLSPDGRWLVCAHQDSPDLTVFRVDPATGRLAPASRSTGVPAVCVVFYD